MKKQQLPPKNGMKKVFGEHTDRQIGETVQFSRDQRDLGYIAENVPCQNACPALTNIPGYIKCIAEKRYGKAYELNRVANILPGVLGGIW